MNPVALRLLNQQLAAPRFHTPEQVVEYLGAVQAQDYRMMRWAVGMRTRRPSALAFKRAYDSGRIVRLHLLRGTWQLVSGADYHSLQALCAPKALSVIRGWMSSNGISLPDTEVSRIREILCRTAADKRSVTKEDFVQALAERDIRMDDHRLSYHIRFAELSGILCSGDLLPMKATYALTASKLGTGEVMSRDETLLQLTSKYFRSRQPATLEDFVWWSGLNTNDCRRGITLAGDYLHTEKWRGRTFYLTEDCRTRGFRKERILLIPPYDEYLISYKSRDLVLPAEYRHRAHNNTGNFQPVIARGGIISGNWSPFRGGDGAEFFLEGPQDGLAEEWLRYRKFLDR